MRQEGQRPGHRVGKKQYLRGVVLRELKESRNPEKTQSTGTEHRNNGRCNAVAHTADGAYDGVHHAAEAIGGTDNTKAHHPGIYGSRSIGVDAKERPTEEKGKVTEYQTGGDSTALCT